jgi:hypothetical protein
VLPHAVQAKRGVARKHLNPFKFFALTANRASLGHKQAVDAVTQTDTKEEH